MAVTVNGTNASGDSGGLSTTLTIAHTLASGANRIVLFGIEVGGAHTISSVTYGGVAMTLVASETSTNNNIYWYGLLEADLPSDGSNNAVITFGGSERSVGYVVCLQDAEQTLTIDSISVDTGTGGISENISAPAATSYILGGVRATGGAEAPGVLATGVTVSDYNAGPFGSINSTFNFHHLSSVSSGSNTISFTLTNEDASAICALCVDAAVVADEFIPQTTFM